VSIKKLSSLIIAVILVLGMAPCSHASCNIPEYIRVGLYFSDPSMHMNTAVTSLTVSAPKGVVVGFLSNDVFYEIYTEKTSNELAIKKDMEPYHIKIGDYPDYNTALENLRAIIARGVDAYIAYDDSWQIWTGMYCDKATAEKYISTGLTALLGQGEYKVTDMKNNRIIVLDCSGKIVCAFGSNSAVFQARPAPENNPAVQYVNSKPYRGVIEVRRLPESDMTVINIVTLREYLYGNVPPEIGAASHPEALKAQAVASSMYAINNLGKHKKTCFDICATTNCQVYRGYSAETEACNKAIDEVVGKVITYNGELAKHIYYFASSAGRTEDPVNVWGSSVDYLKSVEDRYEPVYTWTKTLSASDIKSIIPNIGNILSVRITNTAESGRVTQLAVRGDMSSEPVVYNRERTRTIFGLNSQLYTITTDADVYVYSKEAGSSKNQLAGLYVLGSSKPKVITSYNNKVNILGAGGKTNTVALVPETYTFTGKGWGHAVGMSQEGARAMARAGFKYNEILEHYFPGTKVE